MRNISHIFRFDITSCKESLNDTAIKSAHQIHHFSTACNLAELFNFCQLKKFICQISCSLLRMCVRTTARMH